MELYAGVASCMCRKLSATTLSRSARLPTRTKQVHVVVEEAVDCGSSKQAYSERGTARSIYCLTSPSTLSKQMNNATSPGTSSPRSGMFSVKFCAGLGRDSAMLCCGERFCISRSPRAPVYSRHGCTATTTRSAATAKTESSCQPANSCPGEVPWYCANHQSIL